MAQRYGIMPTEYLASRTRGQFLNDVGAWQTTFLAPMHVIAKALGSGKPDDGSEQSAEPGKMIRSRIPDWHRKAGGHAGSVVWDLDRDHNAERAMLGTMSTTNDEVNFAKPQGSHIMDDAIRKYGRR